MQKFSNDLKKITVCNSEPPFH